MSTKLSSEYATFQAFDIESKKKIDMGPKWSIQEIEIFLQKFRQVGLNELEIQKELKLAGFNRTTKNIQSIYLKNKNFLTLKKNCTAIDLFAVMEDQYEEMEHERKSRLISESDNVITLKRRKPGLTPEISKFEDQLKKKNIEATGEYFSHNKKIKYVGESNHHFKELVSQKRKRKSYILKCKPIKTFDFASLPQLFKIIEGLSKSCNGKNPKKVYRAVDESISCSTIKFVENEFFYSFIDSLYFSQNDFLELLNFANISKLGKLTKNEWNFIRMAQGKPRRFSKNFIGAEIERLNEFRNLIRNFLNDTIDYSFLENHIKNKSLLEKIIKLTPLNVGQIVLALHPVCQHFHCGSVLTTTNTDQNIIKFFTNELGVQKIKDIWISTDLCQSREDDHLYETQSLNNSNLSTGGGLNKKLEFLNQGESINNNILSNDEGILQDLDHYATSFFLKVLEKKTALISELRNFNNYAETHQGELDEKFTQEYGWIGVQINVLDNALKHICPKFRLRGLNNFKDIGKISENFDKILTNPLKDFIDKESENLNSVDPSNQVILKDLKGVVNKISEEKISSKITDLMENHEIQRNNNSNIEIEREIQTEENEKGNDIVVENDVDSDKETKLKDMIFNCLGVLYSLKQTGEVVLTENKFIKNLFTHITENSQEEFHQINDILLNLSIKK